MNKVFIGIVATVYLILSIPAHASIYQCPYFTVCNGIKRVCVFEPGLETTPIWHFKAPYLIPDRGPYSFVEARVYQGQATCAYLNMLDILVVSNRKRTMMPLIDFDSRWLLMPTGEYICRSSDPEQCRIITTKRHIYTTEIYK